MSKIKNGFKPNDNVKVEWCHSRRPTCISISEGVSDPNVPEISVNAGYLILQALDKNSGRGKESKIKLKPPYPTGYNILFSYDTSGTPPQHKWKVEAEVTTKEEEVEEIGNKSGQNNLLQINVNVEIGPKISKFE